MSSNLKATPKPGPLPGFGYRVEIGAPAVMAEFLRFVAENIELQNIEPVVSVSRDEDRGLEILIKEHAPRGDRNYAVFDWLRSRWQLEQR